MNSDSAVLSVLDESFPLEAIHEEADTRPGGADHFGKQRLTDRYRQRAVLAAGACEPQQGVCQALFGGMSEMTDQPFLVVGPTLYQKGGEHFRKIRHFSQHSAERGGGYANNTGVGKGGCSRGARGIEQAADTEEIARTGQRNDGFPAVAHDRRYLDGAAFDEKCRVARVALRINHLTGLKPLSYLAVPSPRQHYSRIENVSSSSRFRQV